MIITDPMMEKLSEPGLWFLMSNQSINDVSNLVYEVAFKFGIPISVNTIHKKAIQNNVIAHIMDDCIETASNDEEKNWLEQEMSEYYEHGFFFSPEHLNDYVENGPFWEEYVHFNDGLPLEIHNYIDKVIIYEDIYSLMQYEEAVLIRSLQLNHEEACKLHRTVIVLVTTEIDKPSTEFVNNHLL